ncbi:unnamed protein product, partial [marine sediment metagenome]
MEAFFNCPALKLKNKDIKKSKTPERINIPPIEKRMLELNIIRGKRTPTMLMLPTNRVNDKAIPIKPREIPK